MNPYFMAAIVNAIFSHRKTCPACKRKQIIFRSKKGEPTRCRHCGAEFPPEEDRSRKGS